jgi:hypothetical protein
MQNHNYVLSQTPKELLRFANYCINKKYYYCSNCGFQLLSLLEEIIVGRGSYEKLYMNYYFVGNKLVNWEKFEGLTCNEIVVKLQLE